MSYFPDPGSPQAIPNFGGNYQFSNNPVGGNRMPQGLGSLLMMVLGNKIWPVTTPGTSQGQFDALWQRQHDMQMLQIGRNATANWFPINNLGGMNQSSAFSQIATSMLSNPNGMAARMMAPILGGNPVLAQMSTFSNMQGINMAGLGTLRGVNAGNVEDMRQAFDKNFYSHETRDSALASIPNLKPDLVAAIKEGFKDAKFGPDLIQKMKEAGKADPHINAQLMNLISHPNDKILGVNYKNTLGFAYEDLIGAMNSSIVNRLAPARTLGANITAFSNGGPAVGALDALRSYFGNDLSGKQLAEKASDFIGFSDVGMDGRLEDRLRLVKATARVANIDYEKMQDMISQSAEVARMGQGSARFSPYDTSKLVTDAAMSSAAMSTGMDNRSVRLMGGTTGMIAGRVSGGLQSANDKISMQLSALYQQGDQATKDRIVNYVKSGNLTSQGFAQFLQTNIPGGAATAMNFGNNAFASALGFQDKDFGDLLRTAGGKSRVASAFEMLNVRYGGGASGAAEVARARKLLGTGDLAAFLSDGKINAGEFGSMWQGLASNGFLDSTIEDLNPQIRAQHARIAKDTAENAEFDKQISRTMGQMNAPILERFTQSVVNGSVRKYGVMSMFDSLTGGDSGELYNGALAISDDIRNIGNAKDVDGVLVNANTDPTVAKNFGSLSALAGKYGITSNQMSALHDDLASSDPGRRKNALTSAFGSSLSKISMEDQATLMAHANRLFGKDRALSEFTGDLGDVDDWKSFYTNQKTDALIDSASKKAYGDLDKEFGEKLSEGGDNTGLYSAIKALGNGDTKSEFDLLHKLKSETGGGIGVTTGSAGETRYHITGAHKDLMAQLGGEFAKQASQEFSSAGEAGKYTTAIDDMVKKSRAGQLALKHDELDATVKSAKENAHDASVSIPALLKQILKKLDLKGLSDGIVELTGAINKVAA